MAKRAPAGRKKMTLQKAFGLLMQEISDSYRTLRGDIRALGTRMDRMELRIDKMDLRIDTVDRKLDNLNLKVDRNHIAFMTNLRDVDERVAVLERK